MRVRLAVPLAVFCLASAAIARTDRSAHIDTVRDSAGAASIRIRCSDIVVRLRDSAWVREDSLLFFLEHRRVQMASSMLRSQADHLRDSLQTMLDSAGAYIAHGRYTQDAFDRAVTRLRDAVERTANTHTYSLRRLEDYQAVLNAARPYLRGSTPR